MAYIQALLTKLTLQIKGAFTIGLSPAKLALTITLAILFGVFPFFFIPTLLIMLSVFLLRLNIAVMLVFNYMAWPLQIILFIPYLHLGKWLFGSASSGTDITFSALTHALKTDFFGALHRLFSVIIHTIGAWAVSGIPAGLLLFSITYYIAKLFAQNIAGNSNKSSL